jgi:hypothetical protein
MSDSDPEFDTEFDCPCEMHKRDRQYNKLRKKLNDLGEGIDEAKKMFKK